MTQNACVMIPRCVGLLAARRLWGQRHRKNKVAEVHLAQTVGYFLALPAKPPRKLSGCCAYHVRSKDGKS
jgi:hypothetical protein